MDPTKGNTAVVMFGQLVDSLMMTASEEMQMFSIRVCKTGGAIEAEKSATGTP
jgi:hypothetical protein